MKQRILTQAIIILIALFTTTISLHGQVTMGSNQPPIDGALLDLTQGTTTTKGLAMPRVTLTDTDKLFPMFDGISGTDYTQSGNNYDKSTEDAAHVGLIVYHNDKCTMSGKGLYVWTGAKWNKIGENTLSRLALDKNYFDLPSGHDARGAVTNQTLIATWPGTTSPNWATAASSGFTGVTLTSPTATGTAGASPYNMTITPTAMPTPNPWSPWMSRQSIITFTDNDCGGTEEVILNQTHYALKVNDQLRNSQIVYRLATSSSFSVQGNAAWITTKSDPYNVLSATTPSIGIQGGEDKKDGTSSSVSNFQYTTLISGRYRTADITFKDTATTKRFEDITVSILSCSGNRDLSLEEWAERAGFTASDITSIAAGGTHPTTQPNGIQLHKDQSGNIFLSGDFGPAGRWMLNNLAATTYAKAHSQGRSLILSNSGTYSKAHYYYPNANSSTFNNNQRLGLLYNWDAATGGKGGSGGATVINDGEDNTLNPPKVQGVCPNGWHLPSDYEWTRLELEINANTSTYANMTDANGSIPIGGSLRGSSHSQGMKDSCPAPGVTTATGGVSNPISDIAALKPGMNVMLPGDLEKFGAPNNYGINSYIWSSNASEAGDKAWYRIFYNSSSSVHRAKAGLRSYFYSVRCKKD